MAQSAQSPAQMDALLRVVSGKLGIPMETLRQDLQDGKFDRALKGMKPQEAAVFQRLLQNPQMLHQMMNSKQVRALYEKLKQS